MCVCGWSRWVWGCGGGGWQWEMSVAGAGEPEPWGHTDVWEDGRTRGRERVPGAAAYAGPWPSPQSPVPSTHMSALAQDAGAVLALHPVPGCCCEELCFVCAD